MALAFRSRFVVGVYNPKCVDHWPYFHLDHGVYMSKAKRACKFNKAAQFETIDAAREFYASWKHAALYRCHILEYKTRVEVPDHVWPYDHPNAIFDRICAKEKNSNVRLSAFRWFMGITDSLFTEKTMAKHRQILLPYGIDIFSPSHLLLEYPPSLDDDTWYLSQPKFSLA